MRVIGAGWGRTGTTSLAAALNRLDLGPCLQMQEMWAHPEAVEAINGHYHGESTNWRDALRGWGSAVDWPTCSLWRELAAAWPDALVVLSLRDPSAWYDSVRGSIHEWTAPGTDLGEPPLAELINRVWDDEFGGWASVLDRDHTIACFEKHNESVRAECPPRRLLEWTVADGWAPLCDALGLPEPDEPFPHLNGRDQ